jgi:hypothetical protein
VVAVGFDDVAIAETGGTRVTRAAGVTAGTGKTTGGGWGHRALLSSATLLRGDDRSGHTPDVRLAAKSSIANPSIANRQSVNRQSRIANRKFAGPPLSTPLLTLNSMTVEELRAELEERGGEADVWLVYVERRGAAGAVLDLHGAFWTRGEAYSCAWVRHDDTGRHFYVYRLPVDLFWAATAMPRRPEFETVFTRARDLFAVAVLPAEVAAALRD